MRCAECGADLPGEESCIGRFHALLAAEWEHPEAAHAGLLARHLGAALGAPHVLSLRK